MIEHGGVKYKYESGKWKALVAGRGWTEYQGAPIALGAVVIVNEPPTLAVNADEAAAYHREVEKHATRIHAQLIDLKADMNKEELASTCFDMAEAFIAEAKHRRL